MKNLVYNDYISKYELEDYLIKYNKIEVKIEGITKFNNFYHLSDIKRINNNKFSLISAYDYGYQEAYDLYIILFDIYNFHDTNLFIRYYYIQIKLYNYKIYKYLLSIQYNGFLGLIFTSMKLEDYSNYQQFSLFSYINSTDSELINVGNNSLLKLNDYIKNENIENNIFGVDLYGIKILKLPSSKKTGVYFFSYLKNTLIFENDILSPDDVIHFIYDYNVFNKRNEIYTIEMAGIVQEKEYSSALEFTIYTQFYGIVDSPEIFYKRKIYEGRTSFYNFTISNNIIGNNDNSCTENCKVCYNNKCIKCQDDFKLIEDSTICQIDSPNNNYYFDENYDIYKRCHEFCKNCLQGPKYYSDILEIEDTNCIECIEDYYKIENTNNCVNKNNIPETYYFDSNKELICKCFENCKTCNQSQINSTYYSCLSCDENSILYEKSGNCLNCYAKGKYANHYENKCIDYIPEGYYLEDEETRALGICYFSCKKCETGGDSNDHRCTECGDNYPYSNKEGTKCLENCSKEYLYTDVQTKRCYNNCIDNIVEERIYNYKNICLSLEDKPNNYKVEVNNFISICSNETYFFFNNECYEICPEDTKIDESSIFLKLCICNNLFYLNEGKQICLDNNECPIEYPYLKPGTFECSKCQYKYKGECFSSCPNNTFINQTINDIYLCAEEINISYNQKNYNYYIDYFNNIIKEYNYTNNKDEIIKILEKEITSKKLDIIIDKIIIKEHQDLFIKENNIIYLLTSSYNQNNNLNNNISTINLSECENELKRNYKINNNTTLLILKIDIFEDGLLIPIIEYEVFNLETKEKLDLNICKDIKIDINIPVNIDEKNLFKYNSSNEYYNNFCYSYSKNNTDIIIKDRRNEYINNNMSLCENNCEYDNYDNNTKKVLCECFIKVKFPLISEIEINKDKLLKNFKNIKSILNINLLKCYKEVFYKEGIINNIGFYIISIIILLTFILSILFKI